MILPPPEPLFFGPRERPLFGWIHRPQRANKLGVVLCNPFGYEAICAHRSIRHFAAAIARAGAPTIRFDYDGAGDSIGDDRDSDRLGAWVKSAHLAVDALRSSTGVESVVLLGMRLGALIATLAAAERTDCTGLVAVAPVVSGRAYLRELRALQMALGLREPPPGAPTEADVQEAVGFRITAATKAELTKVDLARHERRPAPSVLLVDRDDLPPAPAWRDRLVASGAAVDSRRAPGYVEMVADPHKTVVPAQMIDEVVAWLKPRIAAASAPSDAAQAGSVALGSVEVGAGVVEEPVFVDRQRSLFAIQSSPSAAGRSGLAILLLNAGAVHHVGPNRLYVALARRWAALGHLVLRFDNSGIGDSQTRAGEAENVVYSDRALEDVRAAVRYLRHQEGITRCETIGLCAGAYHGFKAAVAGLPVTGVIAINPLTFFWGPDQSLDIPTAKAASEARRYGKAARGIESWKKLLRGKVHLDVLAKVAVQHGAEVARNKLRDVARRARVPLSQDLGTELQTVASRGIDLRFVFAGGDPGIDLLHDQGGSVTERLRRRGRLSIDKIDGPDHTFTPLWSHEPLAEILSRHVATTPAPRP